MAVSRTRQPVSRIFPGGGLLILLWAFSTTAPPHLEAQASLQTYIAIPDAFPEIDARAIVIREPGVDLVLLREDEATVDALMMALQVLRDARANRPAPGDGKGFMMPITGFVVTREARGRFRQRLEDALSRLAAAETVDLGRMGTGRRVPYRGR